MKVLLVAHNFLPQHSAGTEVYTSQLATRLARRGHALRIFAAEKDVALPDLSLREREWEGLPVTELINNLFYEEFRESWDHPRIAQIFGAELERERPDVVHFQHLLHLSIGCVEEAHRRGIGIVFTLHDYWLQCPRHGQRVHADHSLCDTIDFKRCGECLTSFKFAQSPLERRTGRWIAGVRGATGVDLSGPAKGAARFLKARAGAHASESPRAEGSDAALEFEREVALRERAFRERVLPLVHRFLAPSQFLRARFLEWGLAPRSIEFLRAGIDCAPLASIARTRSELVRVAFIGTLVRHKGPHLLLDAWGRLPPELRTRARLELFGPSQHDPAYQEELKRSAGAVGATLRGSLSRAALGPALAEIDLLVVPSLWWENSPLVIHEAIAARTPLLVSGLGGMAELVEPGVHGYHFRMGDAQDLASELARLIERRELLDLLYANASPSTFDEDCARIETLYEEACRAARASRGSQP